MSQAELSIDGYELVNCIATGNFSQVWEVKKAASGQSFAMKLLLPEALKDGEHRRTMKHEASVGKQLDHPNIVRLVESKVSRKQAYIVMELFRSLNVKSLIRADLDSVHMRLKKMMECCTQAFAYMHEKNWLHKDIKPDNILLTKGGEVRVIDFSLASRPSSSVGRMVTRKKSIAIQGTRTYIAPEQIRREKITASSDIYSLGVMFYETLTGRPPFMGTNPNELLMAHVRDRADLPSTYHPNVSSEADDLVMRMLSKKPKDRPESMQQVFSEVRSIQIFKQDPEGFQKKRLAAEAEARAQTVDQRLDSRADAARTETGEPITTPKPQKRTAKKPPTPAPQPAKQPATVPAPVQQPAMPQAPMYQPAMQPMPMQPMMPPPLAHQPGGPPPMVGGAFPPGHFPPQQPGMYPGQPAPAVQQPVQPAADTSPPASQPIPDPQPPPQEQEPAQEEKKLETPDNLDWLSVS